MLTFFKDAKRILESKNDNLEIIEKTNNNLNILNYKVKDIENKLIEQNNELNGKNKELKVLSKKILELEMVNREIAFANEELVTTNNELKKELKELKIIKENISKDISKNKLVIQKFDVEVESLVWFIDNLKELKTTFFKDIGNLKENINNFKDEIAILKNQIIEKKGILRNLTGLEIKYVKNNFYKFRYENIEIEELELIKLIRNFVNTYDCSVLMVPIAIEHLLENKKNGENIVLNSYLIKKYDNEILKIHKLYNNQIYTFFSLLERKNYGVMDNEEKYIEFLKYGVFEKNYNELKLQFSHMKLLNVKKNTLQDVFFSFFKTLSEEEVLEFKYLAFISYYLEVNNYKVEYKNLHELYNFYLKSAYKEYKILNLEKILNKTLNNPSIDKKITIDDINSMTGIEFENFLTLLFKRISYKVQQTKGSGDQGVDLIIEKDNIRYAVQAKRYTGNVGNKAIQEVIAGKVFYNTQEAMVITNSSFTNSAKELANASNVILVDEKKLISMIDLAF